MLYYVLRKWMLVRNLGLSLCSFQKCSVIIYLQNTRAQIKSWRSHLKTGAFRQHLVHHWSVCIIIPLQSQCVIHVFLVHTSLRPNGNLLNYILTLIFACRVVHEQNKVRKWGNNLRSQFLDQFLEFSCVSISQFHREYVKSSFFVT